MLISRIGRTLQEALPINAASALSERVRTSLLASTSGQACGYATEVPNWDFDWLLGLKRGRKSGMKNYAPHQFAYANPNWNPNDRAKSKTGHVSPYAPPEAYEMDPWKVFHRHKPDTKTNAYRRRFHLFLRRQQADWKANFMKSWRLYLQQKKWAGRLTAEAQRQAAWEAFRDDVWRVALEQQAPATAEQLDAADTAAARTAAAAAAQSQKQQAAAASAAKAGGASNKGGRGGAPPGAQPGQGKPAPAAASGSGARPAVAPPGNAAVSSSGSSKSIASRTKLSPR